MRSLRSKQRAHLSDRDVELIIENQSKLNYLELCPCMLTNKAIFLINKHLNNSYLKVLRLENCCNWQCKPNGSNLDEEHMHEQNEGELVEGEDNQRLQLRFQSEEEDDDDFSTEFEDYDVGSYLNDIYDPDLDEEDQDGVDSDLEHENLFRNYSAAFANQNESINFQGFLTNNNQGVNQEGNEANGPLYEPDKDQDEEEEEDDDDDHFDAYLQEYVNRYEGHETSESVEQRSGENARRGGARDTNKTSSSVNSKMVSYFRKLSRILEARAYGQLGNSTGKSSQSKTNECKLFKPSNECILYSMKDCQDLNLNDQRMSNRFGRKMDDSRRKKSRNKRKRIKKCETELVDDEEEQDADGLGDRINREKRKVNQDREMSNDSANNLTG